MDLKFEFEQNEQGESEENLRKRQMIKEKNLKLRMKMIRCQKRRYNLLNSERKYKAKF